MPTSQAPVIVVGAGLSGLNCARVLHAAGVPVLLLEASDAIGGRVRTDRVDGFQLDRGFQVLPIAYPAAKRCLDYGALDLGLFEPGALVRYHGRFHKVSDPLRDPRHAPAAFVSPIGTPLDKLRIAQLWASVCPPPLETVLGRPETSALGELRRLGLSPRMIDRFFRPFLGGICLDSGLGVSSRFLEFVFRMFALDAAALPRAGMAAIPAQLAGSLPDGAIRLNCPAAAVEPAAAVLGDGTRISARAVVVAAGPGAAALGSLPAVPWRGVANLYYAADRDPIDLPILVLNGEGRGLINSLAVVSRVAPSYAPAGASLVSVTVLGQSSAADLEPAVRAELRRWFGSPAAGWRHLRTYSIREALPAQPPGALPFPPPPARREDGIYRCGDAFHLASIHGALESGELAAAAVLGNL